MTMLVTIEASVFIFIYRLRVGPGFLGSRAAMEPTGRGSTPRSITASQRIGRSSRARVITAVSIMVVGSTEVSPMALQNIRLIGFRRS